jgi:hypothetical protein
MRKGNSMPTRKPKFVKCQHCNQKTQARGRTMEQQCEHCGKKTPLRPARDGELTQLLDRLHAVYVKKKVANTWGQVKCVTCGRVMQWHMADAGHYVKRECFATRWDDRNVHPQCQSCNGGFGRSRHKGEPEKYSFWLERNYYPGLPEELRQKSNMTKPSAKEKLEMLRHYYDECMALGLSDYMDRYRTGCPAAWANMFCGKQYPEAE